MDDAWNYAKLPIWPRFPLKSAKSQYFKCIRGSFVVAWKKIDDFNNPTDNNKVGFTVLKESENNVLSISAGFANGLKALESNSEIMVFSDYKLGESLDDKITIW